VVVKVKVVVVLIVRASVVKVVAKGISKIEVDVEVVDVFVLVENDVLVVPAGKCVDVRLVVEEMKIG
jgi:hypothetical protein